MFKGKIELVTILDLQVIGILLSETVCFYDNTDLLIGQVLNLEKNNAVINITGYKKHAECISIPIKELLFLTLNKGCDCAIKSSCPYYFEDTKLCVYKDSMKVSFDYARFLVDLNYIDTLCYWDSFGSIYLTDKINKAIKHYNDNLQLDYKTYIQTLIEFDVLQKLELTNKQQLQLI